MQRKIKALEDQLIQSQVSTKLPPPPEHLAASRSSLLIGIPAVALLISWLDFRIASALAGPHSNQLVWALWLLVSVLLSLWLAIAQRTTWRFAICVAILRSFVKTIVMAYCWSKYGDGHATFVHEFFRYSDLWTQIFLPEVYVFLSAFWLGQWLSNISHTKRINENQDTFANRVRRVNSLTTAIAPVLTFLAAVLGAIITGITAHK
jgi:hypothetical protein